MSRATDICTCGKDRDSHGAYDVELHTFFPHPQPNTQVHPLDRPPLDERVRWAIKQAVPHDLRDVFDTDEGDIWMDMAQAAIVEIQDPAASL